MINNEEAKQKVDDLVEGNMHDFSNWEIDFITSMIDRTEFTDRELEKIKELWKEHCQ